MRSDTIEHLKIIQVKDPKQISEYDNEYYSVLRLNRVTNLAQRIKSHFTLSVNMLQPGWEYRCMDFVTYENFNGRTVISLLTEEQMQRCQDLYGDCHFNAPISGSTSQNI